MDFAQPVMSVFNCGDICMSPIPLESLDAVHYSPFCFLFLTFINMLSLHSNKEERNSLNKLTHFKHNLKCSNFGSHFYCLKF